MLHQALRKEKNYIGLLRCNGEYIPLSDEEEATIRRLLGNREIAGLSTGVIRDGVLQVLDGPLKGMEQYIVHINRHKRKAWLKMLLFNEEREFCMALEVVDKT